MPAQISFRITPRIPRTKIPWRNLASAMFLAAPLLAIAVDTNILQSQSRWGMTLGTLYLLATLVKPLRRFGWCEVATVLFYPASSTVLLATFFLLLRLWKETKLLRGPDERSRTGMLTDLGFRLKRPIPSDPSWMLAAATTAWLSELSSRFWGFTGLAWLPFWLFATSMVSVLTSRLDFEEKRPT